MKNSFLIPRVSIGAASVVALSLVIGNPANAQRASQTQEKAQQQQGQSGQQQNGGQQGTMQQSLSQLEQAQQAIEQAQPTQVKPAAEKALQALQRVESDIDGMRAQAGQEVKTAKQHIDSARSLLQQPQPMKDTVSTALNTVIEDVRRIQQQVAQGGSGSSAAGGASSGATASRSQIDVQQKSAEVQVQQQAPRVTVQQPPPQVTVQQPQPQVTVTQPRPEVTVKQAQPQVSVDTKGEPQVNVQKQGEPKVTVQRPESTAKDKNGQVAQGTTGQTSNSAGTTQQPATVTQDTRPTTDNQIVTMGRSIVGKEIYGSNNRNIGEVEDVVMSGSQVEAVLVDVGGFLGIGARRVAIPVNQLSVQGGRVVTSMTDQQVRNLPEHRSTNR